MQTGYSFGKRGQLCNTGYGKGRTITRENRVSRIDSCKFREECGFDFCFFNNRFNDERSPAV